MIRNKVIFTMREAYLLNGELYEQRPNYVGRVEELLDCYKDRLNEQHYDLENAQNNLKHFQALYTWFRGERSESGEVIMELCINQLYVLQEIILSMLTRARGLVKLQENNFHQLLLECEERYSISQSLYLKISDCIAKYYNAAEQQSLADDFVEHLNTNDTPYEIFIRRKVSSAILGCLRLPTSGPDIACYISKTHGEGSYEILIGMQVVPMVVVGDDRQCPFTNHCTGQQTVSDCSPKKEWYISPFTGKTE